MAKGRMLLKRISMSERVNKHLSCDTSRLLYTWIIAHLDCNGCYYADPILVRNTVFPWRDDIKISDIEKYLNEMAECGLIVIYESNGLYLYFPDFEDKQPKINKEREGRTDIPEPTQEQLQSNSRVTPAQSKIKKSKVNKNKVKEPCPNFDFFWNVYPRHEGKKNAIIAFQKINPDEMLLEKIISAIEKFKSCDQWVKDSGKYIPHPATWLNQERWNDEIKPNTVLLQDGTQLSPTAIANMESSKRVLKKMGVIDGEN